MMLAKEFLAELNSLGFSLIVAGGDLVILQDRLGIGHWTQRLTTPLPAGAQAFIAEHQAELIAALTAPGEAS